MTLINNSPSLLEYLIGHNMSIIGKFDKHLEQSIIGEKWSRIGPGLAIIGPDWYRARPERA